MSLSTRDVHVNTTLSNLSAQVVNKRLINKKVAPIIKVNKRSDSFFKYTRTDSFYVPNADTAPNAAPNEITYGLSSDNYSVKDKALADWVAKEVMDNADTPLKPKQDAMTFLVNRLALIQEKDVAAIVFAAGNYQSACKSTLTGNDQWSDYTNSHPLRAIQTGIDSIDSPATRIVMGAVTWRTFRSHPDVLKAINMNAGDAGMASVSQVSNYLSDQNGEQVEILVGRARYNSAVEGQTATLTEIWGDYCSILAVEDSPGVKTSSFIGTFSEQPKYLVYETFDGTKGVKGSLQIKVGWNRDIKIISEYNGYLFSDCVA